MRTKINSSKYKAPNKVHLPLQMILDVSCPISPIATVILYKEREKKMYNTDPISSLTHLAILSEIPVWEEKSMFYQWVIICSPVQELPSEAVNSLTVEIVKEDKHLVEVGRQYWGRTGIPMQQVQDRTESSMRHLPTLEVCDSAVIHNWEYRQSMPLRQVLAISLFLQLQIGTCSHLIHVW